MSEKENPPATFPGSTTPGSTRSTPGSSAWFCLALRDQLLLTDAATCYAVNNHPLLASLLELGQYSVSNGTLSAYSLTPLRHTVAQSKLHPVFPPLLTRLLINNSAPVPHSLPVTLGEIGTTPSGPLVLVTLQPTSTLASSTPTAELIDRFHQILALYKNRINQLENSS